MSPLHSPKPSLGSPKTQQNPITSQEFEFLPSAAVSKCGYLAYLNWKLNSPTFHECFSGIYSYSPLPIVSHMHLANVGGR